MFSSLSISSRNNKIIKKKKLKQEDIVEQCEIDKTTPITSIQLLTRSLNIFNLGAIHTALLFETQNEYLVLPLCAKSTKYKFAFWQNDKKSLRHKLPNHKFQTYEPV